MPINFKKFLPGESGGIELGNFQSQEQPADMLDTNSPEFKTPELVPQEPEKPEVTKPEPLMLKQGKIAEPKKEGFFTNVAKFVLPRALEVKFGLTEPNLQEEMLEKEKAAEQYLIEKGKLRNITIDRHPANLIRGVLGTFEGAVGAAEWMSLRNSPTKFLGEKDPYAKLVRSILRPQGDKIAQWQKLLEPEDPNFVDDLVAGVGSAATFFIPGMGAVKGVQLLGLSTKVAALAGAGASAFLESATEAGSVWRQGINKDGDESKASWAATKTFWANAVVVFLTNKFGAFSEPIKSRIIRMAISAPMEGVQEFSQQVISNVNTNRPAFEGAWESGAIGTILGIPMGGITSIQQLDETIQQEEKKQAPKDPAKEAPINISKFITEVQTKAEAEKTTLEKNLPSMSVEQVETAIQNNVKEYQRSGGGGISEGPNPSLRDLAVLLQTEEGKIMGKETVDEAIKKGDLKLNESGEISVWRVGNVNKLNELTSVTYDQAFAKTFDRTGKAPIKEFKIKAKDIAYVIGGAEKEILLTKKLAREKTGEVRVSPKQLSDRATVGLKGETATREEAMISLGEIYKQDEVEEILKDIPMKVQDYKAVMKTADVKRKVELHEIQKEREGKKTEKETKEQKAKEEDLKKETSQKEDIKKYILKKVEKFRTEDEKTYYHGTNNAEEILKGGFDMEKAGSNSGYRGVFGKGIYLTNDAKRAKLYGSSAMEIKLGNINLWEIDASDVLGELFIEETKYGDPDLITKYVLDKGYEGVKIINEEKGMEELVIMKPEKLDIGKEGEKAYHTSDEIFPDGKPKFDAYFGTEAWIKAFPGEFGKNTYEIEIPKDVKIINLDSKSKESLKFMEQAVKIAFPNDTEYAGNIVKGDEKAIEDFYEIWTEKENIMPIVKKMGFDGARFKDEILLTKEAIEKVKVPQQKNKATDKMQAEITAIADDLASGRIKEAEGVKMLRDIKEKYESETGEQFRTKEQAREKEGAGKNTETSKLEELNKKLFGDDNLKIVNQIMTPEGKEALGSHRDQMIKIIKGQAKPKDTLYHEAVHKYMDHFTTLDEHVALIEEGMKKYNTKNYAEVEEKIAEDFIAYAKSREGLTGKIKTMFDTIIKRITGYISNQKSIDSLYSDILAGKAKEKRGMFLEEEGQKGKKGAAKGLSEQEEVKLPKEVKSTEKSREKASQKPVKYGTGEVRESQAYKRYKQNIDILKDEVPAQKRMEFATDMARAQFFAEENPDMAKKVARGFEDAPEGMTLASITDAVINQAVENGDVKLVNELARKQTLRSTRAGQEISILQALYEQDDVYPLVQELMKHKQNAILKIDYQSDTTKKKVAYQQTIEKKVKEAKKEITLKEAKLKSAEEILKQITC